MSRLLIGLVPIVALVAILPVGRNTGIGARQSEGSFDLGIVAVTCERQPTAHLFQGGGCVPAEGAVIVVTTSGGELIGTCIAEAADSETVVAGCSVSVPFGSTVVVSEDESTIPLGYAPTYNPQPFDVPGTPPEGVFGGASLHQSTSSRSRFSTASPTG